MSVPAKTKQLSPAERQARRHDAELDALERRRTFARWLWQELGERGWTRADLAHRMGVYPQLIRKWTGTEDERVAVQLPKPPQCAMIAEALRLPTDKVLEEAGHRPRETDPDPLRQDAIDLVSRVPQESLPAVISIVLPLVDPRLRERIQSRLDRVTGAQPNAAAS